MEITPLKLPGTYEIQLKAHIDPRGYFVETFRTHVFEQHGLVARWAQENQSLSVSKGVLRGLHFQLPPHSETKLIRAIQGRIYDVMVDLRRSSGTYGQWQGVVLDAEQHNMVYIPKGFAHGFCTLTENCIVAYKVDEYYTPPAQAGLRWDDPDIGVEWPVDGLPLLSDKDQALPYFKDFETPFE